MSSENRNYVLSTAGYSGGKLYRIAERYLEQAGATTKTPMTGKVNDSLVMSSAFIENGRGLITKIALRPAGTSPSSPKVKAALLTPTDPEDFLRFFETKNEQSSRPIPDTEVLSATPFSPMEFALSILAQSLIRQKPPLENINPLESKRWEKPFVDRAKKLVEQLGTVCPENLQQPKRLVFLLADALQTGIPLPIISWDCFDIAKRIAHEEAIAKHPDHKLEFDLELGFKIGGNEVILNKTQFKTLRPSQDEVAVLDLIKQAGVPVDFRRYLPTDELCRLMPEMVEEVGGQTMLENLTEQVIAFLTYRASDLFPISPQIISFESLLKNADLRHLYESTFQEVLTSFSGRDSPFVSQGRLDMDVEFRKKRYQKSGQLIDEATAIKMSQGMFALYAAETAVLFRLFGNRFVVLQNEAISGPKYDTYRKINPALKKIAMIPVSVTAETTDESIIFIPQHHCL